MIKSNLLLLLFITAPKFVFGQIDHWEQLVNAHDTWTYFKGNSEPPSNWNTVSFNDSTWLSAPGSIGHGNNDDSTIISNVSSLYMRKAFTISQANTIKALILHADFDDGFVAYLNGVEIARANIADSLKPPAYNDLPLESRSPTLSNGAYTWQGGDHAVWIIQDSLWVNSLVNGNNVLAIHTLDSTNSWDLTTKYWLHFATSSTNIIKSPAASWFSFESFESPLPILRINSFGKKVSSTEKIKGQIELVWNEDSTTHCSYAGTTQLTTNIGIKKRGNTSLHNMPKNGYLIESKNAEWEDTDISPLGFPEEEDWVLHGPFADRTYLRNALAMNLARKTGQYASKTKWIELFINGNYEGIYVLMEKIKRDKNRVDIAKLKEDEITGDDLTGGYIWGTELIESDWLSSFYPTNSTTQKVKYSHVYPKIENIPQEQIDYIRGFVDDFEHSLQDISVPYKGKYWDEYIDISSFVDYFLVQEITKNVDGFRASTYYHKDKNSKDSLIKMGPVWDFNFSLGNTSNCTGYQSTSWQYNGPCSSLIPTWWQTLVATPAFSNAVNCRWQELRATVWHEDSIMDFISTNESNLAQPAERDRDRWPLGGTLPIYVNAVDSAYSGDVDILETWIVGRLDWLDSNMIGTDCASISIEEEIALRKDLRVYPNPSNGIITMLLLNDLHGDFLIRNQLGQVIHFGTVEAGTTMLNLELNHLENGIYFVEMEKKEGRVYQKLMIQH